MHPSDMVFDAGMPLMKQLLLNDWVSTTIWHGEALYCVHADFFWNGCLMPWHQSFLMSLRKNNSGHLSSIQLFLSHIQQKFLAQPDILSHDFMLQFVLLAVEGVAGSYRSQVSKVCDKSDLICMSLVLTLVIEIIDADVGDFILSKLCRAVNVSKCLIWCVMLLRILQLDSWAVYLLIIDFQANVVFHKWSISSSRSWPCWPESCVFQDGRFPIRDDCLSVERIMCVDADAIIIAVGVIKLIIISHGGQHCIPIHISLSLRGNTQFWILQVIVQTWLTNDIRVLLHKRIFIVPIPLVLCVLAIVAPFVSHQQSVDICLSWLSEMSISDDGSEFRLKPLVFSCSQRRQSVIVFQNIIILLGLFHDLFSSLPCLFFIAIVNLILLVYGIIILSPLVLKIEIELQYLVEMRRVNILLVHVFLRFSLLDDIVGLLIYRRSSILASIVFWFKYVWVLHLATSWRSNASAWGLFNWRSRSSELKLTSSVQTRVLYCQSKCMILVFLFGICSHVQFVLLEVWKHILDFRASHCSSFGRLLEAHSSPFSVFKTLSEISWVLRRFLGFHGFLLCIQQFIFIDNIIHVKDIKSSLFHDEVQINGILYFVWLIIRFICHSSCSFTH